MSTRTSKQEVLELVQGLPEEASLEDIQYHLNVLQKKVSRMSRRAVSFPKRK